MKKSKLQYAWIILFAIILIRGFSGGGINMTSSLFLSPVSKTIGVGVGTLSIYLSIMSVVMVVWLPIAGKLINKYDVRIMASIGIVLQALSFITCGVLNNVWGWYILAIPQAMGASILVNLLGPIMIQRWFIGNIGLLMGIQMSFVGVFGAILQPFTSNIIASHGWRKAYFIIGGIAFVIVLLSSIFLLRDYPMDKGQEPYGLDNKASKKKTKEEDVNISEEVAVKSLSFYLLILFMISLTGVGVFIQHIPTYGATLGYSIEQTGKALAMAAIGSAIGSIAIGIVTDKIGSMKTSYIIIGAGLIAILGFFMGGKAFYIFRGAALLHGIASSGIMVLAPILTIKFYGQKDYESTFAKVSMGAPLAAIILVPLYGFLYDKTSSYNLVLLLIILLLIISALAVTVGWRSRCKMVQHKRR